MQSHFDHYDISPIGRRWQTLVAAIRFRYAFGAAKRPAARWVDGDNMTPPAGHDIAISLAEEGR